MRTDPAEVLTAPTHLTPPYDAPDLRLVIRRYNWESGGFYGVVVEGAKLTVISEDGEERTEDGERYYQPFWLRHTTTLSTVNQHRIRSALADAAFLELEAMYRDPDVHDGYSDDYRLRVGGQSHTVHCANKTPPQIATLDTVLGPILSAVNKRGKRLDRAQMEAFWKSAYEE